MKMRIKLIGIKRNGMTSASCLLGLGQMIKMSSIFICCNYKSTCRCVRHPMWGEFVWFVVFEHWPMGETNFLKPAINLLWINFNKSKSEEVLKSASIAWWVSWRWCWRKIDTVLIGGIDWIEGVHCIQDEGMNITIHAHQWIHGHCWLWNFPCRRWYTVNWRQRRNCSILSHT